MTRSSTGETSVIGGASRGHPPAPANEVRLVGRVSQAPERRSLPSGDVLVTLRVVVDRPAGERTRPGATTRVDALDCAVWLPRLQRSVLGWNAGDVVDVKGALRRRFFRSAGGVASRVEVELAGGRVIRRAAAG